MLADLNMLLASSATVGSARSAKKTCRNRAQHMSISSQSRARQLAAHALHPDGIAKHRASAKPEVEAIAGGRHCHSYALDASTSGLNV
jgi:hypothetical protein